MKRKFSLTNIITNYLVKVSSFLVNIIFLLLIKLFIKGLVGIYIISYIKSYRENIMSNYTMWMMNPNNEGNDSDESSNNEKPDYDQMTDQEVIELYRATFSEFKVVR